MHSHILILFFAFVVSGCSALFGDKEDDQVNDVFRQGAIDPNLAPQSVGYVPLYPYFTGFKNPLDVIVGYDELVYVVDENGLHILDQKGTRYQVIPIPGATDVSQDRRLHTYVVGRVTLPRGVGGTMVNLAAVYHLKNTATGKYEIIDTLIHPDCDESRAVTAFRGADDEAVKFTGVTCLFDNTVYISRTGPRNDPNSFVQPDNTIMVYDANGKNIGSSKGLNSQTPSIRSAIGVSSIAGYAAPPQRLEGISKSKSFFITQNDASLSMEYRVLAITVADDPDAGTTYSETPSFLSFDFTKGSRFLYEPFRFKKPEDCFVSPDNLQYLFVVDSDSDSLYVFTNQGTEGVNPPATSISRKQVIVSFGGAGLDGTSSGPFQFNDPSGVCFHRRVVYVADKNNNRVCRFVLNTDLQ